MHLLGRPPSTHRGTHKKPLVAHQTSWRIPLSTRWAPECSHTNAARAARGTKIKPGRKPAQRDVKLVYAGAMQDDRRALLAWREALRLAGPGQRDAVLQRVPAGYRDRL